VRYRQNLQAALRMRYKRLEASNIDDIHSEIRLVTTWISEQPTLRAILTENEHAEPWLGYDDWAERQLADLSKGLEPAGLRPCWSDAGRACLAWCLVKRLADTPQGREGFSGHREGLVEQYVKAMSYGVGSVKTFAQRIIRPLIDYLGEQIVGETAILYALERYVRRVEWFDRDELHARYRENTGNGEKTYEKDMRRFLFAEGISMPFSQAQSASGLSDVLAELDTDDPLVCELKIFDGKSRGKRYLAKGVNQAAHYAADCAKTAAYLVIINLSGRQLALPSDRPANVWPPNVELAGVHVHLVAVRALPTAPASQHGRATPVTISRADLIDVDGPDLSPGPS
jgi:hypothetical protein